MIPKKWTSSFLKSYLKIIHHQLPFCLIFFPFLFFLPTLAFFFASFSSGQALFSQKCVTLLSSSLVLCPSFYLCPCPFLNQTRHEKHNSSFRFIPVATSLGLVKIQFLQLLLSLLSSSLFRVADHRLLPIFFI